MSPYDVDCPACYAPAGQQCTAPTDRTRRPVTWTHYRRDDAAHDKESRQ